MTALLAWAALTVAALPAFAQSPLRAQFDAAWARQPESAALEARRSAAEARRRIAESWTADSPALDAGARSDRLGSNQGGVEYQAALALPLWLPGERDRSLALADAEGASLETRVLAARLRLAAEVREAYWAYQRAAIDAGSAALRLDNARVLASDVARRVAAGDLARSDAHLAESAVAAAEVAAAEARALAEGAALRLRALSGVRPAAGPGSEPEPQPSPAAREDAHPLLADLDARLRLARRGEELAAVQTRGNPELTIGAVRERPSFGNPYENSFTVGVRVPFGASARGDAKLAAARAERHESESQLRLEGERIAAEREAALARLSAARLQLEAARRRARLAGELRGFFERSFRLGDSDLPTRLRVGLEADEAERQAARQSVELAAAVSSLRQALGLLPE